MLGIHCGTCRDEQSVHHFLILMFAFSNAEVCYVGPALKSSDGLQRLTGSARWSAGNPGASDNVVIYLDDLVWFQDTDGSIKKGAFSAAGTNMGVTQTAITLDIA